MTQRDLDIEKLEAEDAIDAEWEQLMRDYRGKRGRKPQPAAAAPAPTETATAGGEAAAVTPPAPEVPYA
jgi:hypothetical protein